MSRERFDLIAIGGGLAGLTAALRSCELGLRVLVLEAGVEDRYLCNSRLAMGFFTVAFRDIHEGPAVMRRAIDSMTAGYADHALADALANNVGPALAWLRGLDVRLIVGNWRPGMSAMLAPPAAIGAGLRWPGRGADQMMRRLEARLLARGGRLIRGARVRELMISDRRCIGVVAELQAGDTTFHSDAVVVADGGFQNSPELLREFVSPRPDRVLPRNAGTARGDGLRMARAAGALVTDLRDFYGHVQSADALKNPRLWPYPTVDHLINSGIVVNANGNRFFDEGYGGVFAANAIARQADPLDAVVIFNQTIWEGRAKEFPLPANPLLVTTGARIYGGKTIDDLAASASLPAQALRNTIEKYNAAIRTNAMSGLSPNRSTHLYKPVPIETAPFFAVPVVAGITYTMGGIAIDGEARVKHVDGGVIDGLFAAGSTTGGHEGGPALGYTGGLSKALTFGWCAAHAIAKEHFEQRADVRTLKRNSA